MRIKFLNNVLIIFDRFQMRHDWFFLACPAGYDGPMTFHGETSCYLLVSTGALADAARTSCQTITGGDLVSIEDQDEQNFVAGNTLNNQSHQLPQYFMDRIIKIWKLPSGLNKTSFFLLLQVSGVELLMKSILDWMTVSWKTHSPGLTAHPLSTTILNPVSPTTMVTALFLDLLDVGMTEFVILPFHTFVKLSPCKQYAPLSVDQVFWTFNYFLEIWNTFYFMFACLVQGVNILKFSSS